MVGTGRSVLRLIGYRTGPSAPDWPDPADFVDPSWDQGERETIADDLQGGFVSEPSGESLVAGSAAVRTVRSS